MADRRRGIKAYQKTAGKGSETNRQEEKTGEIRDSEGFFKKTYGDLRVSGEIEKDTGSPEDKAREDSSGSRRAAALLLMVGKERAADILKHLSPEEVEAIVHQIADLRELGKEEADRILSEFHEDSITGRDLRGGAETARKMLLNAFGENEGEKLFRKILPFGGKPPFAFLNDFEYTQIWNLLKNESPRVISLVLSEIDPKKASLILEEMDSVDRLEVVKRMARKTDIHPDVINLMSEKFREKIRTQGKVVTQEIDGASALAGILRYMEPGAEDNILKDLSGSDADLSESIREKIFTIQDILRIPDPDLQKVLRDYDDRELAILIKGKQASVKTKILDNISERRRERIIEESGYLGPMPRKEVAETTKDFLQYLRNMEEEGRLKIPRSEEEWI